MRKLQSDQKHPLAGKVRSSTRPAYGWLYCPGGSSSSRYLMLALTIIATTPMTSTPTLTLLGIGNRVVVSYADNLAICNRCKWAPLALVLQSVPKNFRNSASILDVKVFRSPRISLPTITSWANISNSRTIAIQPCVSVINLCLIWLRERLTRRIGLSTSCFISRRSLADDQ